MYGSPGGCWLLARCGGGTRVAGIRDGSEQRGHRVVTVPHGTLYRGGFRASEWSHCADAGCGSGRGLPGYFAAGLGLYLSDPYTGSNVLSIVLPVSAGVIVPVSTLSGVACLGVFLGSRVAAGAGFRYLWQYCEQHYPIFFALLAAGTALAVLSRRYRVGADFACRSPHPCRRPRLATMGRETQKNEPFKCPLPGALSRRHNHSGAATKKDYSCDRYSRFIHLRDPRVRPSWQGSAIRAAFTLGGTLENFTLARVSAVHRTRCELLTCGRGELVLSLRCVRLRMTTAKSTPSSATGYSPSPSRNWRCSLSRGA